MSLLRLIEKRLIKEVSIMACKGKGKGGRKGGKKGK